LRTRAQAIGLDTTTWLNCAASTEMDATMGRARQLFDRVGGQGTPTMMWSTDEGKTWAYFTNASGQPYDSGGVPQDIVVKTIQDYYNKAKT
jgi:protein-disulfide isomerase-like protein with CxxC motif